jgi:ribosomal protein S18 acetylase RimI-like enzyme
VFEYFLGRLKNIAEKHPDEASKFFQTWSMANKHDYNQGVEEIGFAPARYIIGMVRPCSQPVEISPLPEGIEVRPVEESHMRAIFDAENEAFLDHWGSVDPTETDYQRWLEMPIHKPNLWKVAWDDDQVVGMVRNYVNETENEDFNRQRGYTEEISVRRPWRRKGIARALLTRSIQMFIEMGMEETALGVDTENPSGALKLYQDVGYTEDKRYITYRKPVSNK